ncbi:MAG: glycosyltransferase [Nitrospirota bacterium]|nr:glycosyltransferase [Nitrospirota bacterium]
MVKICYVIGQLSRGGAEKQLYELVKGINRERFSPVVISLSSGGFWTGEFRKLNIQVIELQRRKNREFTRLFRLIRLFRTIKPDIVHTYLFSANSYGRIAAIIAGVPVIIASERSLPETGKDKNGYQVFLDKILVFFSHGIICNSLKASETLVEKYSFDVKKVFTVHNGINTVDFLRETGLDTQGKIARKVVGTVGRLHSSKNYRLFLDMARILLENYGSRNLKFMIIGDGELRDELERYSQQSGIADNVVFTGERIDVPAMLQAMDVFVMTSHYEGFSNAIMEAMLAGLPVVATDAGGNSELVIDGENGFLCPLNDASSLAERVAALLGNERVAMEMGEKGRKRVVREFSVEKMVRETEEIYRVFLGR